MEIIDKCSIFQKAKALWKLKARGSHAPTPESVGSMYGANQWGKSSTKTIPICQEPCMYNWLVVTGAKEFYDFPYIYIYILGPSSSQVTLTPSFLRGVGQPPTNITIELNLSWL